MKKFLAVLLLSFSASAFASVKCGGAGYYSHCLPSQGAALSACNADKQPNSDQSCASQGQSSDGSGSYIMNGHAQGGSGVPPAHVGENYGYPPFVCTAGKQSVPGITYALTANESDKCDGGCEAVFTETERWKGIEDNVSFSLGYYTQTGAYCVMTSPPGPPQNRKACGPQGGSCYDPHIDKFCGVTESGEQVCVPRVPDKPDNCASGATGTVCYSRDGTTPTPSDPPIPPNTPPDKTSNITQTVNSTSTTNNYTVNNYSGTSSGGSGSEAGAPGTSSPGGSNTNQNGSGNTNSGGKGTGSDGKCSDGSVPTASGCSGTYRDNGCDTPPACYGDAVLCGIAANTHKAACNGPASGSSIGGVPNEGDPMDGSGDPHSSGPSEVDLGDGSNLDSAGFGFSNACPIKDVTFSVMGKTVVIPLQDKCDLLAFLRYIVLGLAFFVSAKIIAGVA